MHDTVHSITAIALVALAALACGLLMRRFKQPPVLGYILAGAALGPSALALVHDRESITLLAEMGVLMLLFIIGMELSIKDIKKVWKVAVLTTLFQIGFGLGAMYLLGEILNWPLALTVTLGFVVALSSTAVAIKMLDEIGERTTRVGQITIGILIAQDLAVVPMMLIVSSFEGEGGGLGLDALVKVALSITFLGLLIIYLGRREAIRLPFISAATESLDLMPLAGLAFCFGASALSGLVGLSAAYGAFLAGLVIGNSTSQHAMMRNTAPIQSVLLMVFFLSIGLLLDLRYIWDNIWAVLIIVTFVAGFKTVLNIILIKLLGENWPRAFLSGAVLAQLGEFSFVLAALALSTGTINDDSHRLLVSVTVISLLGSPFWLETARRLHRVVLLGITSRQETLRIALGPEISGMLRSDGLPKSRAARAIRRFGSFFPGRKAAAGPDQDAS